MNPGHGLVLLHALVLCTLTFLPPPARVVHGYAEAVHTIQKRMRAMGEALDSKGLDSVAQQAEAIVNITPLIGRLAQLPDTGIPQEAVPEVIAANDGLARLANSLHEVAGRGDLEASRAQYDRMVPLLAVLAKYALPHHVLDAQRTGDGLSIARAYLTGMEYGQLDALDRLFLPEGRSSILENASDEGSWEHYRDHHLKPEMQSATDFKFAVSDEKLERFGATVLVRQVGTFTVRIGEELRAYRAAVSYVMIEDAGMLRIAHLHWSSRPQRRE